MKPDQQQTITPDKYFKSITELPLCNYVDTLVDNDLTHLIISGNPSIELLAKAWEDISLEYVDAVGNGAYDMYLTLARELALLEINLALVENCVAILQCVYEKKYSDKVNEILRTSFVFDWQNQETYQQELSRCLVRSKSIEINIILKKSQLEGQQNRFKSDSKAPTREYFQSVLISLSDHAKYDIPDSITVYKFCDRIRRLNLYCAQLEKENKRNTSHGKH